MVIQRFFKSPQVHFHSISLKVISVTNFHPAAIQDLLKQAIIIEKRIKASTVMAKMNVTHDFQLIYIEKH